MKSPCQVLSDVDTEEPEAADSLHRSPIDGDGGVSLSLLLPVIHNQLLADVEMEVVILAPRCQVFDLLSRLVAVGDLADDGRVVSKLHDGVGAVYGHTVVCEQGVEERAEHTALRGSGVEDQGGGCEVSHHCLGSARQEVQDPVTEGADEPEVSELDGQLGHNGIEC